MDLQARSRQFIRPPCVLLGILLLGLVVVVLTAGDYGVSWDEGVQSKYGELVLQYFISGGRDKSCNEFSNLRFYGPGFELLAALVYRPWPDSAWLVRHVLSALAALATVPALFRIGRHLGSAWIGVLAGAALLLMPRFYGHAFINSKDIPFACLFAWTMAVMLDHFAAEPMRWWRAVVLGLVAGLMLTVRPAGLVLASGVAGLLTLWKWRFDGTPGWRTRGRFALSLVVAVAIAWVVMVLPWPYAHESPLLNPIRAIQAAVRFDVAYPVLFEGQVTMSDELPRRYLPEYLAITTPPVMLLLAIVGLVVGIRQVRHNPGSLRSLAMLACGIWLCLPLSLYLVQRPNVYDGLRHFLFLLPAIAMWYAVGIAAIVGEITPWRWRVTMIAATVLLTLAPIGSLVLLHPYQMTYFNGSVGGLAGAYGNYETDYWITSYREAMEWINQQAARQPDRTFGVLVAAPKNALATVKPFNAANVRVLLLPQLPEESRLPAQFDYYIGTTRYGLSQCYPDSPVVHTIGRDDAVFTVIRAR